MTVPACTAPDRPGPDRRLRRAGVPRLASPRVWWTRRFRGRPDQVLVVRHWLEDLLPACAVRGDLVLLASELCANAVAHSRSGEPGGQFSVDVDWTPALVRVVVGDQGAAGGPVAAVQPGGGGPLSESGRGLLLVDEVSDDWGTASHPHRRWVWADLAWSARSAPLLAAPGGLDAAVASLAAVRRAFPGTSIWWGQGSRSWWAAFPGATNAHSLISAPTREGLFQSLLRRYPGTVQPGTGKVVPIPIPVIHSGTAS